MYNIKKNGWYLDKDDNLYIYYGNPTLQEKIESDNNKKIFEFIKEFSYIMDKKELRNRCDFLNEIEFNDIFNFFVSKNWIYKVDKSLINSNLRLSRFIDSFPETNFNNYYSLLYNKKILILGLGTGGSYLLEVLTKLGFKKFIIIDNDLVELKNIAAQNYSKKDIGLSKVKVLKSNYEKDGCSIEFINKKIKSLENLEDLVDLKSVNYFINCADDFKLQISLMKNLFIKYPNMKMTYGGYSFLIHTEDFIDVNNYKNLMNRAIEESKKININRYISENTGSILNGFISAIYISKILIDNIVKSEKNSLFSNLYTNNYLLRYKTNEFN